MDMRATPESITHDLQPPHGLLLDGATYQPQFKLRTSDKQVSHLRKIRNGVPQGSALAPTLFNIYISDIPSTTSMLYGYADDLALLTAQLNWNTVEETLTHNLKNFLSI